jgi:hypothetical protein
MRVYVGATHGWRQNINIFRSGRDNRTLVRFFHIFHTPFPFHPQNRGKMVEFSDVFFMPGVRMNGASFSPNRMFIRRTVWPQLTIVTHLLSDLLTYWQHSNKHRKGQRYLAVRRSFPCSIPNKIVVGWTSTSLLTQIWPASHRVQLFQLLKHWCIVWWACCTSLHDWLYK